METFTLKALASNPYGLEALQGTTGFTLPEAMLMCGGGVFDSLAQVFMALLCCRPRSSCRRRGSAGGNREKSRS